MVNRQAEHSVPAAWIGRLARAALAQLGVRSPGRFVIAFVDRATMRSVNRQFVGHRGLTDVVSFRYDGEPVVGEIVVSPAFASAYAKDHGIPYREELARYVLHGLLHWIGHDDRTSTQQRRMRAMENALLMQCAVTPRPAPQTTKPKTRAPKRAAPRSMRRLARIGIRTR